MRAAAALASLAAALLAGCAAEPDAELQAIADRVVPAKRELVGCSWQNTWSGNPEKSYGCFWLVRGGVPDVAYAVLTELAFHEFAVSCKSSTKTAQFTAVKGDIALYVDVLAHGYRHRRGLSDADVDIPDDHVAVDIAAQRGGDLPRVGRPCAVR